MKTNHIQLLFHRSVIIVDAPIDSRDTRYGALVIRLFIRLASSFYRACFFSLLRESRFKMVSEDVRL